MNYLINGIYSDFISDIGSRRSIADSTLLNIVNEHALRTAEDVLKYGMVDQLANPDEAIEILKTRIGLGEDDKIEMVSYGKYKKVKVDSESTSRDRIAVLIAEGEINTGESDENVLGSFAFYPSDISKVAVARLNP